jgi:G3E family GTPase
MPARHPAGCAGRPVPDPPSKRVRTPTRLALFGGFLGSGKTTLMVELGRRLAARGTTVALVTNDQGELLVDSRFARDAGFAAAEVLNGCFCCRFPDFLGSIDAIRRSNVAELVLAEPVGSCTDLLATVMAPLERFHRGTVRLAPLSVLVDAPRLLGDYTKLNLESPEDPTEVLVAHQLQEADVLLVSKVDLVRGDPALETALERLKRLNRQARLITTSVRSGEGLEEIRRLVEAGRTQRRRPVELDYEVYAEAEAEYGWYNGQWELVSEQGMDLMEAGLRLLRSFPERDPGLEVAHAKLHVVCGLGAFKLSSVMGLIESDGQYAAGNRPTAAELTLNVRARTDPDTLSRHVEEALNRLQAEMSFRVRGYRSRALVPSAPRPTYRLSGPVGS